MYREADREYTSAEVCARDNCKSKRDREKERTR